MKYYFCTYFDSNYFMYGYTLFRSLKRTGIDFTLFVCSLDDAVYENLPKLNHPEIVPIRLKDIETWDPEFAACRTNRTKVEYYFTLSPVLPLYILEKYPGIDILGYLDSDLYFFSSPERIYQALGEKSLLIVEHDLYPELKEEEKLFGKYNMAFQLYRNDAVGSACLKHWRRECIDWCYDRCEDGKFADQKYLEEWQEKFDAVICPRNIGAGLAPWNCGMHKFDFSDEDHPRVDGVPLIYYHYQEAKIVGMGMMISAKKEYVFHIGTRVHDWLYSRYYHELLNSTHLLSQNGILVSAGYAFARKKGTEENFWKRLWQKYIKKIPWLLSGILNYHGKRYFAFTFGLERFFYFMSGKKRES